MFQTSDTIGVPKESFGGKRGGVHGQGTMNLRAKEAATEAKSYSSVIFSVFERASCAR
jgi:hypothetical protein